MIWVHRYACVLSAATLLLVAAGGMVTSTQSGLSVPDWPTTYGYQMFSFPLSGMVGGIFYEHGHRLIASVVGLLTIGLALALWRVEPRRWVRRLGFAAVAAVVLQGVLGGLTVLYLLPDAISISHAGLAQIFFCLSVTLAVVTSPRWRAPALLPVDDARLAWRMVLLTGLVYVQVLIGATMRHTGAGLAIPDFPLVYGGLLPPAWTFDIAIHYAHRAGAVLVTAVAIAAAARIWSRHAGRPDLVRPAWLIVVAVAFQVALGGLVVLSGKQPTVNTLHVTMGAVVLVASLALTLRTWRIRFTDEPTSVTRPTAAGLRPASEARHA
jgi:cytochrome c oxidase assembly protein subunit 15